MISTLVKSEYLFNSRIYFKTKLGIVDFITRCVIKSKLLTNFKHKSYKSNLLLHNNNNNKQSRFCGYYYYYCWCCYYLFWFSCRAFKINSRMLCVQLYMLPFKWCLASQRKSPCNLVLSASFAMINKTRFFLIYIVYMCCK